MLYYKMKKMVLSKLKSPFTMSGRSQKESASSLIDKSYVYEEYMEAFRTKSYTEMCYKVQSQLGRNVRPSSSSSSHSQYIHLSDLLLEPREETIVDLTKSSDLNHLLLDYFEAGLEACKICEILLQSVHQASTNHLIIKRVIKLVNRVHDDEDYITTQNQCNAIFGDLASYSSLKNPMSTFSPDKFPNIHNSHSILLKRLTSKCRRIRRRRKLIRCLKKVGGCSPVVSYTVLAIALLVIACHSIVGIIASPGLIASSFGLLKIKKMMKKKKLPKKGLKARKLERLGSQLDVAAKGIYTLIIDFDTVSLLVGRLYDEIEFSKAIANMCVRNGKMVLKEVVRELQIHESCFLEHLEELEDHIYLCLLGINRSRRLLVEKITTP